MPASTGYYDDDILCIDSDDAAAAMGLLSLTDDENSNDNGNDPKRSNGTSKSSSKVNPNTSHQNGETNPTNNNTKTNTNIDLFAQANFLRKVTTKKKKKSSKATNDTGNGRSPMNKNTNKNMNGTKSPSSGIGNFWGGSPTATKSPTKPNTNNAHTDNKNNGSYPMESPENDLLGLSSATLPMTMPYEYGNNEASITNHDIFMNMTATPVTVPVSVPPTATATAETLVDVESTAIPTATPTATLANHNQELLGLDFNYGTTPTADLLGFTASTASITSSNSINSASNNNSDDDNNSTLNTSSRNSSLSPQKSQQSAQTQTQTQTTPQSEIQAEDELLTLDYTPPPTESTKAAMKINEGYIALEQMRVANLEIEFSNYNKKCEAHFDTLNRNMNHSNNQNNNSNHIRNKRNANNRKKKQHKFIRFDSNKCVQCLRAEFISIDGIDAEMLFGRTLCAKIAKQNKATSPTKKGTGGMGGVGIGGIGGGGSTTASSAFKSFRFKNDKPCLMCGSPTCKKHSDPGFLKTKIAICAECSPLFSLDFIVDCVTLNNAADEDEDDVNDSSDSADRDIYFSLGTVGSASTSFDGDGNGDDNGDGDGNNDGKVNSDGKGKVKGKGNNDEMKSQQERRQNDTTPYTPHDIPRPVPLSAQEKLRQDNIKHMVDVYDRVYLMLTYSAQFIDEITTKLETNTKREDRVGLSSNSIGIASGLAGIAAAAAVVTPAGPPLIVASLLFGATAQASSSGSKLVNYYSAPNKIALKIISYYNLLKSILVVTNVLRDALLKDHINLEQYVSKMIKAHDEAMIQLDAGYGEEKQLSTPSKQQQEANDEVDFEDDWETDDDSTVVSMRSKSSNIQKTLEGIKEESADGEDSFGDFQMADTFDSNSVASWVVSPKTSPNKEVLSPSSSSQTKATEKPKEEIDETLMERKTTAGKLARFYSRSSLAGTSLVGAATVTVFAGAALSLAHVAFEANNFASTLKKIQAGSPSKRAQVLRNIKEDIQNLPETRVIAEEWDNYLVVLEERRKSRKKNILSESFDSDACMKGQGDKRT